MGLNWFEGKLIPILLIIIIFVAYCILSSVSSIAVSNGILRKHREKLHENEIKYFHRRRKEKKLWY